MKILIVVCTLAVVCAAAVPHKRLGVPLTAEDDCNPNIGALNYSADPNHCQIFYQCDHGWPKIKICPGDTVWTPTEERCLDPYDAENVICAYVRPERPIVIGADGEEIIQLYEACEFQCESGEDCIAYTGVCDGTPHCTDASDELDCAAPCDENNCRLPNCRCTSADIPGGLTPNEVPQLVMLAWDEAVRLEDYNHLYQQIFKKVGAGRRQREPRTNPDGCPLVGTFFTSHQFTDYAAVQSLYSEGNEFATHSVSKRLPAAYWRDSTVRTWSEEILTNRLLLSTLGHVPVADIVGMRAPYLQTAGDATIDMLAERGFVWDSSFATDVNDPPLWPYTFTYRSTAGCAVAPCPVRSHPNVWEIPLVDWIDTNDTLCENVDSCYFPNDKAEALELLRTNFARHYETNRAPFPINLRARWFLNDGHHNLEALQEFLDELAGLRDVYFVTYSQVVQWMRAPRRASDMPGFFDCRQTEQRERLCERPNLCGYFNITYQPNDEEHPGERYFQTCSDCPETYPWVEPLERL